MLTSTAPDPLAQPLPAAAPPTPVPAVTGAAAPPFAPTLSALLAGVTMPFAPDGSRPPVAGPGKPLPPTGEDLPVGTTPASPAGLAALPVLDGAAADEAPLFAPAETTTADDGDPATEPALAWLVVPPVAPARDVTISGVPVAVPVVAEAVNVASEPAALPAANLRPVEPFSGDGAAAPTVLPREPAGVVPAVMPPPGAAPAQGPAEPAPRNQDLLVRHRRGTSVWAAPDQTVRTPASMPVTLPPTDSRPMTPAPVVPPSSIPAAMPAGAAAPFASATERAVTSPPAQAAATASVPAGPVAPSADPAKAVPVAPSILVGAQAVAGKADVRPAPRLATALPATAVERPVAAIRPATEAALFALRPDTVAVAALDERAPASLSTMTVAPPAQSAAPVAAAAGGQQAGIDLTQDPGMHRMIDRIEQLRDAANAGDTRIRLIPDALGPVDVSVRRDGDAVHVRFAAQHEATRQLIVDATPRLTELAEARGVRIDRTSVESGAGQPGAQGWGEQSRHPAWAQPNRPGRPTAAATVARGENPNDQRIA